jgi:glycosyltransferase involved in cell wall biosynthesis
VNVTVILDQRFYRTPEGTVWTGDSCGYSFFRRYLQVFDSVLGVARLLDVPEPKSNWQPSSGPGVAFAAVPHYQGPWQYLLRSARVKRAARSAIGDGAALILRVPGQLANVIEPELRRTQRPYGVEVVGDPFASYSPAAMRHPLRPILRKWFHARLRAQCRQAAAVAYVTAYALQQRYPCSPGAFATHYSSVDLPEEAFAAGPRVFGGPGPARLIAVASLQYPYKGVDLLIDALGESIHGGLDAQLEIAGEGKLRSALEARAAALGLANHVRFLGAVRPGADVRACLDRAGLFVHPSRAEGLPRAVIEAMARGLPCVASRAGGIPELLAAEDTVPVGDAQALARKIAEVVRDAERLTRMSKRNLAKAREYSEDALDQRRKQFYSYLREATKPWMGLSNPAALARNRRP